MLLFNPELPIQSPSTGTLSSLALHWSELDVAHIPWDRLQDFVDGEGKRVEHMETSFWIRDSKFKAGSVGANWLCRKTLWCAFGPTNTPSIEPIAPPRKGTFPKEGLGSRPRAQKKLYNNHQKRGCQCHFRVTQFKVDPDVCVIYFTNRSAIYLPPQ